MGAEARRILVLPERVGRVDRALRVSKLTGHRSIPETLSRGEVTVDANALWHTSDALACMGLDADYRGPHPGSDAPIDVVPVGRGLSGPPSNQIGSIAGIAGIRPLAWAIANRRSIAARPSRPSASVKSLTYMRTNRRQVSLSIPRP